tara:strand:- start:680 stop:1642 length:963 start_codon:yes stop_codon:yes gene_type:complete
MSKYLLEFEKSIKLIEDKIESLKKSSSSTGMNVDTQLQNLEEELKKEFNIVYSNLSRWQKVELARHPDRPHTYDYINLIADKWIELHGDRKYEDDKSIISGIAIIGSSSYVIIGHEKGRGTKEKLHRNFGMAKPEGYRKALRVMKIAEKFKLPIITLIDTPGAYPGIGAEERGQAQAIADNLFEMSLLEVPIISIVIGEGASGGALAIGLADKIFCLENTWYSVISPEGCASILFHDTTKAKEAADSMKVASEDLFEMGIADKIIKEPFGGAHNNYNEMAQILKDVIINEIKILKKLSIKELIKNRLDKYNNIGHINNNE